MIRLLLLFLGTPWICRHRLIFAILGVLWMIIGGVLFIDALDGLQKFPMHLFGYLVILHGVVLAITSWSGLAMRRKLLLIRAAAVLSLGILIVNHHLISEIVIALVFGVVMLIAGVLRIAAAKVVHFRGWQMTMIAGFAEVAMAIFIFGPWPDHYTGTVQYCVGFAVFLSG